MTKIKNAMVFAAGLGTRMQPITLTTPKPMVPVNGKPMLDYRIEKLQQYGAEKILVNTFYLPEQIENHLKIIAPNAIISRETERLETGGGLLKALEYLSWDEPLFITNSDVIWIDSKTPALQKLADAWDDTKMDALLLLNKVSSAIGYHGSGDFNLLEGGKIKWISPSPADYVFTGISIIHPRILNNHKTNDIKPFSLSSDVFRKLLREDKILNRIYGLEHTGHWLHIDSPDSLQEAEEFLANNKDIL